MFFIVIGKECVSSRHRRYLRLIYVIITQRPGPRVRMTKKEEAKCFLFQRITTGKWRLLGPARTAGRTRHRQTKGGKRSALDTVGHRNHDPVRSTYILY